ncbi:hypothetical protein HK104_009032 [Borealophlyctis nickersoniae]|nr:hypothetical protein HK104_009032 [Borealophlyctis nickersoniae]
MVRLPDGRVVSCADEPIHTPGTIQAFGVLLVLHAETLKILQVSENSRKILGLSPDYLLRLRSFTKLLTEDQEDIFLGHIDELGDADVPTEAGPDVFELKLRADLVPKFDALTVSAASSAATLNQTPPESDEEDGSDDDDLSDADDEGRAFYCAIHRYVKNPGVIVVELELDNDPLFPFITTMSDDSAADDATNGGKAGTEPIHPETFKASTVPKHTPLGLSDQGLTTDPSRLLDVLTAVNQQLSKTQTVEELADVVVGLVKEITGYHRIMMIRFLYDRELPTARMMSHRSVSGLSLDMSFAYLRALSPIHLKYLANMNVRASLSISTICFGDLWGMIVCHAYTAMRNPLPLRKCLRFIGEAVAQNIERIMLEQRIKVRDTVTGAHAEGMALGRDAGQYVMANGEEILGMFRADIGIICLAGEVKPITRVPEISQITTSAWHLAKYIQSKRSQSMLVTHWLQKDYPDYDGPADVAGFLVLPLSDDGESWLAFFRAEQLHHVNWAGNPYLKSTPTTSTDPSLLDPRQSFQIWTETVRGRSPSWRDQEIETATVLQMMYWRFIDARRKEGVDGAGEGGAAGAAEGGGVAMNKLKRLLLSNATHEIRTPMNHLVNCIEMALEKSLDPTTRAMILQSHETSKSLIGMINDLLEATKQLEVRVPGDGGVESGEVKVAP